MSTKGTKGTNNDYRTYRAKGITLSPIDCLIAATALAKGYKVATRNVKHYPEKGIILDF